MKKRPDDKTLEISAPVTLHSKLPPDATAIENGAPENSADHVASLNAHGNPVTAITPRHRTGTVARLPKPLRDEINHMLDDGFSFPQLIRQLGASGKGLAPEHIRRWKSGGYQDYLREQRLLQQCRLRQELALNLVREKQRVSGFQATQQLASAQICGVVADLGAEILREALIANPLNYFRMLNAFSRIAAGGLKCECHLADEAVRKALLQKQTQRSKKGISRKAQKQMESSLNLL